jgi:hypothetical protein
MRLVRLCHAIVFLGTVTFDIPQVFSSTFESLNIHISLSFARRRLA